MSSASASSSRSRLRLVLADGRFLVLAIGLAFDDKLPSGALQPVDSGLGEERICHERKTFTGVASRGENRGGGMVALDADLVDICGLDGIEVLKGVFSFRRPSTHPRKRQESLFWKDEREPASARPSGLRITPSREPG